MIEAPDMVQVFDRERRTPDRMKPFDPDMLYGQQGLTTVGRRAARSRARVALQAVPTACSDNTRPVILAKYQ